MISDVAILLDTKDTVDIMFCLWLLVLLPLQPPLSLLPHLFLLGLLDAVNFSLPGMDELLQWWEQFLHSCLHLGDLPVQVGWQ